MNQVINIFEIRSEGKETFPPTFHEPNYWHSFSKIRPDEKNRKKIKKIKKSEKLKKSSTQKKSKNFKNPKN